MSDPAKPQDQQAEIQRLRSELAQRDKMVAELQNKPGRSGASEVYAKQEHELGAILINGVKKLSELPGHLQDPLFLLHMVKTGQLELGRPPHYFNSRDQVMPGDGEWSWTDCASRGTKPLPDLLAEEKALAEKNQLRRTATMPKDMGGDEKSAQKSVDVDISLRVRLAAR